MRNSVRSEWIFFNDPLEGRVHFMYLDVKGWVSTGIGNKIDNTASAMSPPSAEERASSLRAAAELNWVDGANNAAGSAQIAADWDAVKARLDLASQGYRAFEPLTSLRLSDGEIDQYVLNKLDQFESQLSSRTEFAQFGNWPADAQLAVLSMSWGLGPAFAFPKFQSYAAAGDWNAAAEECRMQPDEATIRIRNILDKSLLQSAARVVSEGLDPSLLTLDLGTTLGLQRALRRVGDDPGPEDGADGPRTRAAITAFQNANGLSPSGTATDETIGTLASQLDPNVYNPVITA